MKPDTTSPSEKKHSISWNWIVTPCVVLLVYLLSFGPMMKLIENRRLSAPPSFVDKFYAPWFWAYFHTPLQKPLGKYGHLWSRMFNEKGELIYE